MARITPSALVDDIKGSLGGVTFSSWKGMSYVKSRAKSVRNPATADQVLIRNGMTFFSRRYYDDLSDAQRAAWDQYAQEVGGAARSESVQGGFGSRVVPQRQFTRSGYNWYVALNVRMLKAFGIAHFAAPLDDAPLGVTPPSQPALNGVTYRADVGDFQIDFTNPVSFGGDTEVSVAIWVLPNYAYARVQAQFNMDTPGQNFPATGLNAIKIQRAAIAAPLPDGLYAFQMDAVGKTYGLVSPPSEIKKVGAKHVPV